jgi:hypothetical protein
LSWGESDIEYLPREEWITKYSRAIEALKVLPEENQRIVEQMTVDLKKRQSITSFKLLTVKYRIKKLHSSSNNQLLHYESCRFIVDNPFKRTVLPD